MHMVWQYQLIAADQASLHLQNCVCSLLAHHCDGEDSWPVALHEMYMHGVIHFSHALVTNTKKDCIHQILGEDVH